VILNAPTPQSLARNLRQLADRLDDEGDRALTRADIYAARGYGAATINGGIRGGDNTSSTERAALNPHPFVGIDDRYTAQRQALWAGTVILHSILDQLLTHADDSDPIPAGTGECVRCGKMCRPTLKRPHDRRKAGFCPACHTAWVRAHKPDRSWFIHSYLTEATVG
jgi:hypothetical protein